MKTVEFEIQNRNLLLCYTPDEFEGVSRVEQKIAKTEDFKIKRIFCVNQKMLVETEDRSDDTFRFRIGDVGEYYTKIDSNVISTEHDFYFSNDIRLTMKMFSAYRDISILGKIDEIIDDDFYIGGDWENHNGISFEAFSRLIDTFPKSAELDHYANMRISTILKEYYPECEKYKALYENVIQKKSSQLVEGKTVSKASQTYNLKIEQAKFEVAVAELEDMLRRYESIPESEWQEKICGILRFVYPKYIAYSRETKYPGCDKHYKKPDFLLVDSCGFVDILEIKKANVLVLSQAQYRNNYVPSRELFGAIQQTEKYIYALNTREDAREIVCNNLSKKVPGVDVQVLNPQGMILLGRNTEFVIKQQSDDFELIKRQYKNIADIMTYDDLLQRLKNIVAALREQSKIS